MLDKYKDISDEFNRGDEKFSSELKALSDAVEEIRNHAFYTLEDIQNADTIIDDIDQHFSEKTGILNRKDMAFLWGAVGIQCARWLLSSTIDEETLTPTIDDRKDSSSEGQKDKTASGDKLNRTQAEREGQKYPDKKSIMVLPVPYDAMEGTEDIVIPGVTDYGKNIYSHNHHSATLGHDPILGYVFGSANIMTRSITFKDSTSTTRKVEIVTGRVQKVVKTPRYDVTMMLSDVLESAREDIDRIPTALLKERLHLQSDKFTKTGLPIPLLSADKQQTLLEHKWNSKELEDVLRSGLQGTSLNSKIAWWLNTILGTLHSFCYDECKDGDISVYCVRTSRIIATSNIIAESLNLALVAAGVIAGILGDNDKVVKKSISRLDAGGIIEAIHRVVMNRSIQEEIRREFLEKELYNRFTSYEYSFLEEASDGEKGRL